MAGLAVTLEEAWWVQGMVRRTDHLGEVWDREDMAKLHAAILALQGQPPDSEYQLDVGDGFLWQVEAQVPQTLDLGRSNIGRRILLKVFAALSVQEEGGYEPVPAVFRDVNGWAIDAPHERDDASDYADDLAGSDAGAEGKSA